jgi:predicted NAD/FAD-binding protein
MIHSVRLSTPIQTIQRNRDTAGKVNSVTLTDNKGVEHAFDSVIVAAHGDDALKMLMDPTQDEHSILSNVAFSPNRAVLHSDTSVRTLAHFMMSS